LAEIMTWLQDADWPDSDLSWLWYEVKRLDAQVTRLQEYERRWETLQRLAHHWRQLGGTAHLAANAVELALLQMRWPPQQRDCTLRGHDCATWQPPILPAVLKQESRSGTPG